MKLAIAAAAVLTAAIATNGSAATGSAATALARPAAAACSAQRTTVKGHTAYIFCGPATGTLSVGGTTYSFHGGTCIKGSTLIVAIGESVEDDTAHNGGKPDFDLSITGKGGILAAYSGGENLLKPGGLAIVAASRPSAAGSFHGKNAITGAPFSGSWNCH